MKLWDDIQVRYKERTRKSAEMYKRAKQVIPYGVGSNIRVMDPHPFFVAEARGSRIWDVDGNEYIDFGLGFGALMVGHAHPKIVEAIGDQVRKGTMYTLPHALEAELAEEVQRRFPSMELMRFTNTGLEATMHPLRVARAYTGKDKIVKIEGAYHGAHDDVLISVKPELVSKAGHPRFPAPVPASEGIPKNTLDNVIVAPFNDLEAMREILEENFNEVAAVLVEPVLLNCRMILPDEGYLQGLRELTREYNILLIFDEVKTGFKIAPGGACEYFNIEPDLVCLAKAIGGGLSLGAFGGRREVMEQVAPGKVSHAGTYNTNPLVMRAGVVTLKEILTAEAYEYTFHLNRMLVEGYEKLIADTGLKAYLRSIGPMGAIFFSEKPIRNWREFARYDNRELWINYWFSMVNEGIIPHPWGFDEQWTICVQHTKEDVEAHLSAFAKVAPLLAERARKLESERKDQRRKTKIATAKEKEQVTVK